MIVLAAVWLMGVSIWWLARAAARPRGDGEPQGADVVGWTHLDDVQLERLLRDAST
jgi:high-affinity Fe2+/Pb2+ permease